MTLHAYEVSDLKRAIRDHVDAQVELSWIGSKMADEHELIELNAKVAKENLDNLIKRLS